MAGNHDGRVANLAKLITEDPDVLSKDWESLAKLIAASMGAPLDTPALTRESADRAFGSRLNAIVEAMDDLKNDDYDYDNDPKSGDRDNDNIHEAGSRRNFFTRWFDSPKKPDADPEQPADQADDFKLPDVNRRGFMAASAGLAAHASGTGGAFSALASDSIYDKMTDAELLSTPEQLWMGKISPRRAQHIAMLNPGHGHREAANKIFKLLQYGFNLASKGVDKLVSKQITNSRTKDVLDAQDGLSAIGKQWNLKASEILDDSGEMLHYDENSVKMLNQFEQFVRQHGQQYGIEIDSSFNKAMQDAKLKAKNLERRRERERERKDAQRRADKDYELDLVRWSGEGGASGPNESYIRKLSRIFESRLNAIVEAKDDPEYDDRDYDNVFHGVVNDDDPMEDLPGGGLPTSEDNVHVNVYSKDVIGYRVNEDGENEMYVPIRLKQIPYLYDSWDQLIAEIESQTGKAWVIDHSKSQNAGSRFNSPLQTFLSHGNDTIVLIPKAIEDLTALESRRGRGRRRI